MPTKPYDIFISYRRVGGYETARHIYDLLKRDGYSVSFDQDNLMNGNFDKVLLDRIAKCKDFILICDADVFSRTIEEQGDKEHDWLFVELAEALKLDKNVIPIMLRGFTEFPEGLPDEIKDVRYKNGPQYDTAYFDAFYERLKQFFVEASADDNIVIKETSEKMKISLLLEHGWHCYNQGKYNKAMDYFLEAADMGSANAINAIALYYFEGHGYERNLQKAAQWFRYAAEMGYASAQRNLADCLLKGFGVTPNKQEAFAWYMRGAEKGNSKSQYMVGECYANGWGVEINQTKAQEWYEKASCQGYEPAIGKLESKE